MDPGEAIGTDRAALRRALEEHACADALESEHRDRMLRLLAEREDCFLRSCFPGHFTASALVLSSDGSQTLLTHHQILDRWLQFGGHCDGDANTLRAALREATEESGIEGITPVHVALLDVDIHPIPANPRRGEPAHEHFDLRYLLRAPAGAVPRLSDESKELRWFTPEEMLALTDEPGLVRLVQKWRSGGAPGGSHTKAQRHKGTKGVGIGPIQSLS
jgi:8-oxo-dGTP pyrophosphatase MutT (NUDIX family)